MNENVIGKLYLIKIKDRKENEYGILIQESKDWILFKSLFTDYMVDGYKVINKRYISSIERGDDEIFTEEVLKVNDKISFPIIEIPLDGNLIFNSFKESETVFQISLNRENVCYIGYIDNILPKSIYLTPLDKKGNWLDYNLLFRMDFIRIIEFDTDYINSLLAYNKKLEKRPS